MTDKCFNNMLLMEQNDSRSVSSSFDPNSQARWYAMTTTETITNHTLQYTYANIAMFTHLGLKSFCVRTILAYGNFYHPPVWDDTRCTRPSLHCCLTALRHIGRTLQAVSWNIQTLMVWTTCLRPLHSCTELAAKHAMAQLLVHCFTQNTT